MAWSKAICNFQSFQVWPNNLKLSTVEDDQKGGQKAEEEKEQNNSNCEKEWVVV